MKYSIKTIIIATSLFSLIFILGFMVGRFTPTPATVNAQTTVEQPPEFVVFWEVWQYAHQYYIDQDKLVTKNLVYGAINGLLQVLGDEGHTRFLPPQDAAAQKESISGKFYGIGATVNIIDDFPTVLTPIAGSPAEAAGILAGDVILKVNGTEVKGFSITDAVNLIRGDEGTEVTLTIFRPKNEKQMDISIIRGEIKLPAATWTLVPETKVGLILMSQFSANLDENIVQAVKELKEAGAESLILDVRNNPGGLLDQCIRVSSQFLKDGNVLLEEDPQHNRKQYQVIPGGVALDIPLVILTNLGSASAAEIFAGALQDQKRGKVIGEKTFGTGTVLQPFDLSDGSTLLLGVSQWLTPQGRLIRQKGIEPDIAVSLPADARILFPGVIKDMTKAEIMKSQDTQMLRALEELNAIPSMGPQNSHWQELQLVK